MLWLSFLAAVTILALVLREVLLPQIRPRGDRYSNRVAIDYLNTGVAWVGPDDKICAVNAALPRVLEAAEEDLVGHNWYEMFVPEDRERVREAVRQMLLTGKASVEARGVRPNGAVAWLELSLVAVHDHKARLLGLHCLAEDRTRQHELEERVDQLTRQLTRGISTSV
jgi:PAS domain S-box-containing protein